MSCTDSRLYFHSLLAHARVLSVLPCLPFLRYPISDMPCCLLVFLVIFPFCLFRAYISLPPPPLFSGRVLYGGIGERGTQLESYPPIEHCRHAVNVAGLYIANLYILLYVVCVCFSDTSTNDSSSSNTRSSICNCTYFSLSGDCLLSFAFQNAEPILRPRARLWWW